MTQQSSNVISNYPSFLRGVVYSHGLGTSLQECVGVALGINPLPLDKSFDLLLAEYDKRCAIFNHYTHTVYYHNSIGVGTIIIVEYDTETYGLLMEQTGASSYRSIFPNETGFAQQIREL